MRAYIGGMKQIIAPLMLSLGLALSPVLAQEAAPETPVPPPEAEDGFDLMEEGAKLLLRGLLSEVEPAMRDMEKAITEMEPALRQLMEMVGDIRNYHPPEMLPNGDIIIRRKTPLEAAPQGATEL